MNSLTLQKYNDNLKIPQNLAPAKQFLDTLSPDSQDQFIFQVVPDSPEAESRGLYPRTFHGKFEHHCQHLVHLNNQGCGIFVTVNRCRGQRRLAKEVVELRASFIDKDDGNISAFALRPTMVVQSKSGQHAHWRLRNGEDLTRFTPAQLQLSKFYGSDSSVKDLPRAMRIPGFLHLKDPASPFLVTLLEVNDVAYSMDEIFEAHQIVEKRFAEKEKPIPRVETGAKRAHSPAEWEEILGKAALKDGRNTGLTKIAGYLLCKRIQPRLTWLLCHAWNEVHVKPPLTKQEVDKVLNNIAHCEHRSRFGKGGAQ